MQVYTKANSKLPPYSMAALLVFKPNQERLIRWHIAFKCLCRTVGPITTMNNIESFVLFMLRENETMKIKTRAGCRINVIKW